jgi:signal transduction histidine kinase
MASQAGNKVLVIDDDPETRANLRDILELDGYEVETAATGRQVLAREGLNDFLAILLDRRLPDGIADTLLPQIKRIAPNTEVIVATGHADLDGTITAVRYGAADYLVKPIDPDVLRATLNRIKRLKEAERRALQAERLAAIGQMAVVLAHEGRGTLQQIAVSHALLASRLKHDREALNVLNRAENAKNGLARLFKDLSSFASPLLLERESLDLRHVWRKVWADLSGAREGRIAQLAEKANDVSLHCDGDRFRLEQVFRNLFENALAACPDPVRVEMRCSETTCHGQPALRLVVADNGPGLTPDQQRKAFEPFYTTKSQGTGLGLAIVGRIIEAHGGEIALSNGHHGAEFVIDLPRMLPPGCQRLASRGRREDFACRIV